MMNRMFLDPLYGPMTVDSLARELIFSSDFQRLRNVRLCNINSLFIPRPVGQKSHVGRESEAPPAFSNWFKLWTKKPG